RDRCGSQFSIIVVSEGAMQIGGSEMYIEMGTRDSAPRLGGVGNLCGYEIQRLTGKETRCVVLGHLQRGGSPNAFDRMLATNFGATAVRAIMRGEHGVMVALQAANIVTVPLSQATGSLKTVPPNSQLVRTARDVGISFGSPNECEYHHSDPCR
ncbi:MAG: 6-phosphofructokinase, partial [Pyrinomonadaceae bacterium]|nr:6-phosphofructokinase [Pyrinomonadaceae bacterium]